jgi:hypothetical protein
MKITYISSIVLIQTVFFTTVRAQVEPCLTNPIFSDTCCPIVMNEILPEGYGGESWVEFYNCNSDTVSLFGWFLTNEPSQPCKFPLTCIIIPQTFFVLPLPVTISRSFGSLQLWKPDTTLAYGMTFDGVHIGESIGYCGTMILRQEPSPGALNTCHSFTAISEIVVSSEKEETFFYDFLGRQVSAYVSGIFISVTKKQNGERVRKIICFP